VSLRFEQQTGPTGNLPGLIAEFTWNGGPCTKTHSKQRSRRAKANGGAKQLNHARELAVFLDQAFLPVFVTTAPLPIDLPKTTTDCCKQMFLADARRHLSAFYLKDQRFHVRIFFII